MTLFCFICSYKSIFYYWVRRSFVSRLATLASSYSLNCVIEVKSYLFLLVSIDEIFYFNMAIVSERVFTSISYLLHLRESYSMIRRAYSPEDASINYRIIVSFRSISIDRSNIRIINCYTSPCSSDKAELASIERRTCISLDPSGFGGSCFLESCDPSNIFLKINLFK